MAHIVQVRQYLRANSRLSHQPLRFLDDALRKSHLSGLALLDVLIMALDCTECIQIAVFAHLERRSEPVWTVRRSMCVANGFVGESRQDALGRAIF